MRSVIHYAGAALILCVVGIVGLAVVGVPIPDELKMLSTGLLGVLGTLLARPDRAGEERLS